MDVLRTNQPCRRTALIEKELDRYRVDIAAVSKTRLADTGSLEERGRGYTVFWSDLNQDDSRIHGIGFIALTSFVGSLREFRSVMARD